MSIELFHEVQPGLVGSGSLAVAPNQTPNVAPAGQGKAVSVVKFAVPDKSPRAIFRSPRVLTATAIGLGTTTGVEGVNGPLIGIARWGSGNGSQAECEFDIPMATGFNAAVAGQQISVMGDSIEILMRNDANVTPRVGDNALGNPAVSVQCSASIAMGNRASSGKVTRTVFGVFQFPPKGAGLAAGDFVAIPVPAFARTFTVFRHDDVTAAAPVIAVDQFGTLGIVDGPYTIATGAVSPEFVVNPTTGFVEVHNPGPATINVVGIIFTLGL